jgi:hypothetical protein
MSYFDLTNGDLWYATCSASCLNPRSWQRSLLDGAGRLTNPTVGYYTSLGVDGGGTVHVSYHDVTHGALKYLERSP